MTQSVSVQLKLRRAFRYGFYALLALVAGLLTLLGIWTVDGNLPLIDTSILPDGKLLMVAALALAFSVPLFFAAWLLIGTAIFGLRYERPSMMVDGAD